MNSNELCMPAYLNQSTVFDMMAIIEDGFSNVKTIKSSTMQNNLDNIGVDANVETQLGVKNIFSLFSVGIKGKYDHSSGKEKDDEEYFEKVHTPVSLFWKLRDYLVRNSLLKTTINISGGEIAVGNFVEVEATFHKNPIIESIENFQKLMDLALIISPESLQSEQKQNPGGGKTSKNKPTKKPPIIEQVDAISSALTLDDSIDFLATSDEEINMVITCDKNFFINNNVNRIVDGKYRVLGKIVSVFDRDQGKISLLRTTSFSRFKQDFITQMFSGFSELSSAGIELPEIVTEIQGPCIQIVPIGIFI